MPIQGLTTPGHARLPVIGKIRKGGAKVQKVNSQGKPYEVMGPDLDHFRFVTDDAALEKLWMAVYGPTPREVNVLFPYPTVEECFDYWRESYSAGSLLHRCDGVTSTLWLDPQTNQYRTDPVPCSGYYHAERKKDGCKPVGRLTVLVREFSRLAHVTVETHSLNDIKQLVENLEALFSVRRNLRGIPCVLQRRERQISTPNEQTGKRSRRAKWLLFVEADPQWVVHQLAAFERAATPMLSAPEAAPQIEAPTADEPDDYEEGEWSESDVDQETGEILLPTPDPIQPPVPAARVRNPNALAEVIDEGFEPDPPPIQRPRVTTHEPTSTAGARPVQQAAMPMAPVSLCPKCGQNEVRPSAFTSTSKVITEIGSETGWCVGCSSAEANRRQQATRAQRPVAAGGSR